MSWLKSQRQRLRTPQTVLAVISAGLLALGVLLGVANLAITTLRNYYYFREFISKHPRMTQIIQGSVSNWLFAAGLVGLIVLLIILRKLPESIPATTAQTVKPVTPAPKQRPDSAAQDYPPLPPGIIVSDSPVPWPPMPADGILHDIRTADSLEELRATLGVRMMTPAQNELTISELPNGIFGYSAVRSFGVNHYGILLPLSSLYNYNENWLISNSFALTRNPGRGDIEIHKSAEGHLYVAAFVSDEAFISLSNPRRVDRVKTILRLQAKPEANHLVAISRERLCSWRNRTLEDGEIIADVEIR